MTTNTMKKNEKCPYGRTKFATTQQLIQFNTVQQFSKPAPTDKMTTQEQED